MLNKKLSDILTLIALETCGAQAGLLPLMIANVCQEKNLMRDTTDLDTLVLGGSVRAKVL